MRVRQLSPTGDMTFGQSAANYLVDTPEAVAQIVKTRLLLVTGEWFLDVTDGTPWTTEGQGARAANTFDAMIQSRILSSPGVTEIVNYASSITNRVASVVCSIKTIYDAANTAPQQITI